VISFALWLDAIVRERYLGAAVRLPGTETAPAR
jgi:hypothetical protein